jgi:hypothetical protein
MPALHGGSSELKNPGQQRQPRGEDGAFDAPAGRADIEQFLIIEVELGF